MSNTMATLRRAACAAAALALTAALALPALAAPEVDASKAVIDTANVLSNQTETYVTNISIYLQDTCGAQIGVYTVDYIGNNTMEGYTYQVAEAWGIGSSEDNADNGVVLLLATGDDDYRVVTGGGLAERLPSQTLSTILDNEMEPSWINQDYDAGTQKTVRAIAEQLATIYGLTMDVDAIGAGESGYTAATGTAASQDDGVGIIGAVVVIFAIILIVLLISSFSKRRRRRGYGAPPPAPRPAPPRYRSRGGMGSSFMGGMVGGMSSEVGRQIGRQVTRGMRGNSSRQRRNGNDDMFGGGGLFGGGSGMGGSSYGGSRSSGLGGSSASRSRSSGASRSSAPRSSGGSFKAGGGSFRGGSGAGRNKH